MKVLTIITARSGSKGVKNKNILKFKKKPLIFYTIEFAKKLKFSNKLIISTDSSYYLKLINKKFNLMKNHLRPKKLSSDKATSIDTVKYEYQKLVKKGEDFDAILLLQPNCPFRKLKDFKKAYQILKKNKANAVITIKQIKEHPFKMYEYNKNFINHFLMKNTEKISFQSRQSLKSLYLRQGSMYFFKTKLLKKNLLMDKKTYGILVKGKYGLNIDYKEDLIIAREYFKR